MLNKIFFTFILTICFCSTAPAQYLTEHFTTDNGLPQNSIKKLYLDKLRFLWFVTEDGLVRYDGLHFSVYNSQNLPHISQNRFVSINYTTDNSAVYAININNTGIRIADGKPGLNENPVPFPQLALPVLNEVHIKYLAKVYGKEYQKIMDDIPKAYWDNEVFPLTDTSFAFYGGGHIYLYSKYAKLGEISISGQPAPCKFFSLGNHAYFVTRNARIGLIDLKAGRVLPVSPAGDYQQILSNPDVNSFDCFKNWHTRNAYLQNGDKLYRLSPTGEAGNLQLSYIADNVPLNNQKTFEISDDEHLIFFGSTTDGLYILRKKEFDQVKPGNVLLNEYSFYGLVPYAGNQVFTSNGYLLNGEGAYNRLLNLEEQRYLALFNDTIFFYQQNKLAAFYNKRIIRLTDLPDWLVNPGAMLISKDRSFVWIAYAQGIAKYWPGGRFEKQLGNIVVDKIAPFPTYCLTEDPNSSALYLGTSNSVYSYNYETKTSFFIKELEGKRVRSLAFINKMLLIGTEGDGYYVLLNGQVKKMPLDEKGYLNAVHCFVADKKGRVWMPTNKGLFMTQLSDIEKYISSKSDTAGIFYYRFDQKNGITNTEFNGGCQPCAALLNNGRVAIPGIQGITSFAPDEMPTPFTDANIVFDKVKADTVLTNLDMIRLAGGLSEYKFYWTSSNWSNTNANSFEYNIKGLDENWNKIENGSPVILSNLSKGNYTLQIRKKIPGNKYLLNKQSFKILPRWYETLLFYCLVAGLLILLLGGLFRLYTIRLKKKNESLERMVAKRTRELEKSNKELAGEVQLKNEIVALISHDMITPLNYMSQLLQGMSEENKGSGNTELADSLRALSESANGLHLMATNTISLIKFNKDIGHANFEDVYLYNLVTEKCNIYKIGARKKDIELINNIAPSTIIQSEPTLLGLVIQNIINNSIKFTNPGGYIEISGSNTGQSHYELEIRDNGMGMSAETLEMINLAKDKKVENHANYYNMQKIGWKIIIDILPILKINYKIRSTENEGTSITLQFPSPAFVHG